MNPIYEREARGGDALPKARIDASILPRQKMLLLSPIITHMLDGVER